MGVQHAGSAAAVASGLLPFTLGNDAGGSVRVPAALCGCVGFMVSRGRIGPQGPSLSLTIGQNGFLTGCVRDAALLYALTADRGAAPLRVPVLKQAGHSVLQGLRVGVYWPWFDDCDEDVRHACRAAVAAMQAEGTNICLYVLKSTSLDPLTAFACALRDAKAALCRCLCDRQVAK